MSLLLVGYTGAVGIVIFGLASVRAFVLRGRAREADPLAFAVLAGVSTLLAVYAFGLGDPVFLLANIGSALANGVVALAAWRARRA